MSGANPDKGVGVTLLAQLFDLTPMRIQQLASAGIIVKVSHGTYDLKASIKGYVKFLRERADRHGGSRELTEVKRLIAEEELKKKKRENAVADNDVLDVGQVISSVQIAMARWDGMLTSKLETEGPPRLVGKSQAEMRVELQGMHDELRAASKDLFAGEILDGVETEEEITIDDDGED